MWAKKNRFQVSRSLEEAVAKGVDWTIDRDSRARLIQPWILCYTPDPQSFKVSHAIELFCDSICSKLDQSLGLERKTEGPRSPKLECAELGSLISRG